MFAEENQTAIDTASTSNKLRRPQTLPNMCHMYMFEFGLRLLAADFHERRKSSQPRRPQALPNTRRTLFMCDFSRSNRANKTNKYMYN